MKYFKIFLWIVLLLLIDFCLASLLRPHFRAATLPAFETFYSRYVSKEAENFDIVFFGDSRVQHGIDSRIVSEECDCNAGNIAVSGSTFVSTYYLLRDYLEQHDPKLVALGVHWSRAAKQKNPDYYPLLLEMKTTSEQFEYVRESYDLNFVAQRILRSYEYRKALRRFVKGEPTEVTEAISETGDQFMPLQQKMSSTTPLTSQIFNNLRAFDLPADAVQIEYLEKTIKLVQSKDIQILLFETPELAEVTKEIENATALRETLEGEAAKLGVPYVSLEDIEGSTQLLPEHYADVLHVNEEGALSYTKELWKVIKSLNL